MLLPVGFESLNKSLRELCPLAHLFPIVGGQYMLAP